MILTSSGTGAMEAAVVNVVPPGGKALILNAGHFAARWGAICKAFGINAVMVDTEWGKPVDPDQVAEALKQHPDAVAVFGTLSETSTGTGHPVEAIGRVVAKTDAVFVVDGISGIGAMECRPDDWGIDVLCAGSQKALMLPPGLAFISVSPKAWAKIDAFESHSYYFSLKAARSKAKESDTPYTPAHTLILALRTALRRIKAEGVENVWKRHKLMSEACQAGVQALGLELFSARPAEGLTAFRVPDGLKDSQIRGKMADRFGVQTVGGQAKLKGKIVRIGHMGYTDELDVISALAALEMTLSELGFDVEPGKAVTAAQQVFLGKTAGALA
jgi:aspartate aminotransferase-like enzyme